MTDHARAIEADQRILDWAMRIYGLLCMLCGDMKAIEAGARAIDPMAFNPLAGHEEGRCPDCDDARNSAREKAKACIEAAITSGALVPASAVAAERERCAAIIDSYAQPDRFKPSEQWKEDMTVAEVYETGVIDAMGWAAKEVRSLPPAPASGEFVVVPRVPTQAMIEAGCEANPTQWNEGTDLGFAADVANDIYGAMLNAATKDGEEKQ